MTGLSQLEDTDVQICLHKQVATIVWGTQLMTVMPIVDMKRQ